MNVLRNLIFVTLIPLMLVGVVCRIGANMVYGGWLLGERVVNWIVGD